MTSFSYISGIVPDWLPARKIPVTHHQLNLCGRFQFMIIICIWWFFGQGSDSRKKEIQIVIYSVLEKMTNTRALKKIFIFENDKKISVNA